MIYLLGTLDYDNIRTLADLIENMPEKMRDRIFNIIESKAARETYKFNSLSIEISTDNTIKYYLLMRIFDLFADPTDESSFVFLVDKAIILMLHDLKLRRLLKLTKYSLLNYFKAMDIDLFLHVKKSLLEIIAKNLQKIKESEKQTKTNKGVQSKLWNYYEKQTFLSLFQIFNMVEIFYYITSEKELPPIYIELKYPVVPKQSFSNRILNYRADCSRFFSSSWFIAGAVLLVAWEILDYFNITRFCFFVLLWYVFSCYLVD